jgi:hypothetical protein
MVEVGENWKCPYCGYAQVLSLKRFDDGWQRLAVEGELEHDNLRLVYTAIVCANTACRRLSLAVQLGNEFGDAAHQLGVVELKSWTLLPPSSASPQPSYIPQPLQGDYYEACAIRDLSPKASATMTRRCLQGMIRDFCGIQKMRLIDEINELRDRVHRGNAPVGVLPDTVDAIDRVREIGNIGAHMEADINVIVDVDPDEAQILIELVETLFAEWYVARHDRTERLSRIAEIAAEKKAQKQPPPTTGGDPS